MFHHISSSDNDKTGPNTKILVPLPNILLRLRQLFGENSRGEAWTIASADTRITLTDMNGGSALNYLLLGSVNILWIPSAMKFGRKIVYILSLAFVMASGIWCGFY